MLKGEQRLKMGGNKPMEQEWRLNLEGSLEPFKVEVDSLDLATLWKPPPASSGYPTRCGDREAQPFQMTLAAKSTPRKLESTSWPATWAPRHI